MYRVGTVLPARPAVPAVCKHWAALAERPLRSHSTRISRVKAELCSLLPDWAICTQIWLLKFSFGCVFDQLAMWLFLGYIFMWIRNHKKLCLKILGTFDELLVQPFSVCFHICVHGMARCTGPNFYVRPLQREEHRTIIIMLMMLLIIISACG